MTFKFPLAAMLKPLIGFVSTIVESVMPHEITPEQKKQVQNAVGTAYAIAKNYGKALVASTENDLDDAVLIELVQVCEAARDRFGLELDPTKIEL